MNDLNLNKWNNKTLENYNIIKIPVNNITKPNELKEIQSYIKSINEEYDKQY